jgi:hypothetical protein
MIQYRYQTAEEKRKTKAAHAPSAGKFQSTCDLEWTGELESTEKPEMSGKLSTTIDRAPVLLNEDVFDQSEHKFLSQWLEEPQEPIYNTTSEAWWNTNENAYGMAMERGMAPTWSAGPDAAPFTWTPEIAASGHTQTSRYLHALAILPKNTRPGRVISYEDTEAHDAELLKYFAVMIRGSKRMDNDKDPFSLIPQFKHPKLNSVFLVRRCNRVFSSKATLEKWLPVMLSNPHIILSSTIMASTWLDMHAGICGESKRTILLKQESIGFINERLRDARAAEDSTLAIIAHVLAGEMWSCNEKTLRIHQAGIARLIAHRGGMSQLGGHGLTAQVSAA